MPDDIQSFFSREEVLDALTRGGLSEIQVTAFMKDFSATDGTSMFISDSFFDLLAASSPDAARRVRLFRDALKPEER